MTTAAVRHVTTPAKRADPVERDLRRIVSGAVTTARAELDAHSHDFGRVTIKRPRIVVRPASVGDIAAVVRYAASSGLTVTAQGAAHTQGGQALSESGILVDMHGFGAVPRVDARERLAESGAGRLWRDVVERTVIHKLIPPVLTSHLSTTLGGTTAVGGIGRASFRHGAQIDHHVELEVVAGTGDVVRCSADDDPELFAHALGGLGQFGIVTHIRFRLRKSPSRLFRVRAAYESLDDAFAAAEDATTDPRVEEVHTATRFVGGRWMHDVCIAADPPLGDDSARRRVRAFVANATGARRIAELPFEQATLSSPRLPRTAWGDRSHVVAPGLDLILPRAIATTFIADSLRDFPASLAPRFEIVSLFLRRTSLRRPMLALPDGDDFVEVGFQPKVPAPHAVETLNALADIARRATGAGSRLYPIGWLPRGRSPWRQHFGERYTHVQAAKRRYDPDAVFASAGVRIAERPT